MRSPLLPVMILSCVGAVAASAQPADPYPEFASHGTDRSLKHELKHQLLSPFTFVRSAASAGIGQLRDRPAAWGEGAAGYAKRFASAYGTHIVASGVHYGVSTMRHEELSYQPSGLSGAGPRLKYALESTVITHKTTNGEKTVAAGEISGAMSAGLVSRLWQPAAARTVVGGLASGGIMLAGDAGTHVVREFWPEIRRPFGHREK